MTFQSLFWWISLLGKMRRSRDSGKWGFQSLFWWISLLGALVVGGGQVSVFGFNPCFGGSRSSACACPGPAAGAAWFQSLFWWISLLGRSHGFRAELVEQLFQSLFWWISLLGGSRPRNAYVGCVVSILVLVDLAPRPSST